MNLNLESYNQNYLVAAIKNKVQEKLGKIPKRGIFAGQAVASAIYEILGITKNAPYRDIDIFGSFNELPSIEVYANLENELERKKSIVRRMSPSEGKAMLVSSFDITLEGIDQGGFSILKSYMGTENKKVNFVEVEYHRNYNFKSYKNKEYQERDEDVLSIIKSFDFNCVQVAIDLRTNKLIWTRAFQDFIFSKEIKSINFSTPMHTSIRMLKKERELDFATLDIDVEMEKLQTVRQIGIELEKIQNELEENKEGYIPGSLFSKTYMKRFNENRNILEKYFELDEKIVKKDDKELEFGVLKPKSYHKKTLDMFISMEIIPSIRKCPNDKEKYQTPFLDSKICEFEKYFQMCSVASKKNQSMISLLEEINENKKGSIGTSLVVSHLMKSEKKDLSGLKSLHLKRLIKFTDKHPIAIAELLSKGVSIRDVSIIAKNLNWADKNNMRHFIGFVEQGIVIDNNDIYFENKYKKEKPENILKHAVSISEIKAKNYDTIKIGSSFRIDEIKLSELLRDDFIEYIKEKNKIILSKGENISVEPIATSVIEDLKKNINIKFSVKEISDWSSVILEGALMKHCVGGYWRSIEEYDSCIFHLNVEIDGKSNQSTIQLSYNRNKKEFSTYQHYGELNSSVSNIENELCEKLRCALNEEIKKTMIKEDQKNNSIYRFIYGSKLGISRKEAKEKDIREFESTNIEALYKFNDSQYF